MIHVRTAYQDHDAIVRKGRYIDGSTALVLEDPTTGERLAKATRVHERVGCQACRGATSSSRTTRRTRGCLRPCRTPE